MTPQEEEFKRQLDVLGGNARLCTIFLYTQLAFDLIAGSTFEVRDRVNRHAGFWNGILGGLQASTFIALGRIFDTTKGTNNAGRLLRYAADHPGLFSRASLEVAEGLDPALATQYASEAHHFKKVDLKTLHKAFDKYRAYYDATVGPVRHKVFAHAGQINDRSQLEALFAQIPIRKLEKLTVFPLRLHSALWMLFVNGIEPSMRKAPTNVKKIADAGLGAHVGSWEHLHTVADTLAFLEALHLDPEAEAQIAAHAQCFPPTDHADEPTES